MSTSAHTTTIEQHRLYHVFGHSVGHEQLFKKDDDYERFLDVCNKRISPAADFYSYCLLSNHFHFYLRVNQEAKLFSKAMSDAFNSYARYFNTKYSRMGSLFVKPFKRRLAEAAADIIWLPWYIHRNPLHHGLPVDWRSYRWSSYGSYVKGMPSIVKPDWLLQQYGGLKALIDHHELNASSWEENLENS